MLRIVRISFAFFSIQIQIKDLSLCWGELMNSLQKILKIIGIDLLLSGISKSGNSLLCGSQIVADLFQLALQLIAVCFEPPAAPDLKRIKLPRGPDPVLRGRQRDPRFPEQEDSSCARSVFALICF